MALKYKAFISYSHKDRHWAAWLHKRFKTYRIPTGVFEKTTSVGPEPVTLKPIFRDHDELTAGTDLGQKIEAALKQTQSLIVMCSPHAAKPHWINEETLFFKRQDRGANVFKVIVDGEPFATSKNTN